MMKKIIGGLLVSSPVLAMLGLAIHDNQVPLFLMSTGIAGAIVTVFLGGLYLLMADE